MIDQSAEECGDRFPITEPAQSFGRDPGQGCPFRIGGAGSRGCQHVAKPFGVGRIGLPHSLPENGRQRVVGHRGRLHETTPGLCESAWGERFRIRFLHPVDRAEDVGLGELGAGATELIPAAGVDHEQAAIAVLQHVGGMEVHVVAHEKIAVGAGEGRAVGPQLVAGDLVQVEERGEEVVLVARAKDVVLVAAQSARCAGAELDEGLRQFWPGAFHRAVVEHIVLLAEDRAVGGVADAVAEARLAEVDEGAGEEDFALAREGHTDRVVHAARHDDVEPCAVGPHAEDVRGAVLQDGAVAERVGLFGERAFGPVEEAVRPEIGTVDVVGAAGEGAALEPFLAFVGHAVAIGVGEFPDARRPGDIDGTGVPETALREHDLVREDDGRVVDAVAVGVFQAKDAMRGVLELLGGRGVGAGGIGHVEPAAIVDASADGALDEVRRGDAFDDEAGGHDELAALDGELGRRQRVLRKSRQGGSKGNGQKAGFHEGKSWNCADKNPAALRFQPSNKVGCPTSSSQSSPTRPSPTASPPPIMLTAWTKPEKRRGRCSSVSGRAQRFLSATRSRRYSRLVRGVMPSERWSPPRHVVLISLRTGLLVFQQRLLIKKSRLTS